MRKRLTAALAITLSLLLIFFMVPSLPMLPGGGVAQAFQVDLLTRMQTLELAVFGTLKADTSTVGYLTNNVGFAQVTLTAAQIDTMYTTPVQILAAPGAGKMIIVDKVLLSTTASNTLFSSGGAVSFVYHGTSSSSVTSTIAATALTGVANGSTSYAVLGPLGATNGTIYNPASTVGNLGVDITNATGVFAGNGTAQVYIWYKTLTF